jgi:hypothetical protein
MPVTVKAVEQRVRQRVCGVNRHVCGAQCSPFRRHCTFIHGVRGGWREPILLPRRSSWKSAGIQEGGDFRRLVELAALGW